MEKESKDETVNTAGKKQPQLDLDRVGIHEVQKYLKKIAKGGRK